MDIVALLETRLPETGSVRERDFTLFWHGKPSDEVRKHSVGFTVRNRLLGSITPPAEGTERILSLWLQTSSGPLSLISTYAPTFAFTAEAKDKFYDILSAAIRRIPDRELLFIAGNFDARVGVDHKSWPTCLGQFGIGKMNGNGQCLLELCCHHGLTLYVSDTFNTASATSLLETHTTETLASAQTDPHQTCQPFQHQDNSQIPEHWLWHWPLFGVWQCEAPSKEFAPYERGGPTSHRHQ